MVILLKRRRMYSLSHVVLTIERDVAAVLLRQIELIKIVLRITVIRSLSKLQHHVDQLDHVHFLMDFVLHRELLLSLQIQSLKLSKSL